MTESFDINDFESDISSTSNDSSKVVNDLTEEVRKDEQSFDSNKGIYEEEDPNTTSDEYSTSTTSFEEENSSSTQDIHHPSNAEKEEVSFFNLELLKNCWNFLCFFTLGYINNVPYSVAIVAGQSLSIFFGQEHLYGFIIWANIFLGMFTQIGFILVLRHANQNITFILSGVGFIGSVTGVVCCIVFCGENSLLGFWLTVLFILLIGGICSIGLSVIFRFLSIYDRDIKMSRFTLSGVGAGTGMSGLGGSGVYVVLKTLGFSNIFQFGILIPVLVVFIFIPFFCIIRPKHHKGKFGLNHEHKDEEINEEDGLEKMTTVELIKDIFQGTWFVGLNTVLIYFSGYLIQTGISEKMFNAQESILSPHWAVRNSYETFSFLFRLGIFITRSTSMLFQSGRRFLVGLTITQIIVLVVWFIFAKTRVFSNPTYVWFLFATIFFSGLVSGFEYVNAYFIIMNLSKFRSEKSKEIAIYVNMAMEDLGIVICSFVTLFIHSTVLRN